MKKGVTTLLTGLFIFASLFILESRAYGQTTGTTSPALPDDVKKIVTTSCTPCHTSEGSLKSRIKLNIDKWSEYSEKTQKDKAADMYKQLRKGDMPPKVQREKHPELIPTAEQIDVIKKWSESFGSETK
jgi:hypothetical protein